MNGDILEYDIEKRANNIYHVHFDGQDYLLSGENWQDQLYLLKNIRSLPVLSLFLSSPGSTALYSTFLREYGTTGKSAYDHPDSFIAYLYERSLATLTKGDEFLSRYAFSDMPGRDK
jgi:hypothetical protein